MANKTTAIHHDSVGAWAKRCYMAGRAAMEAMLRPYDLGTTQWYVLHRLAHDGPTMQRELVKALQVERATLSAIIGALVRKGLVEQVPDRVDQRQKLLRMTAAGTALWKELPDLEVIHDVAFKGLDDAAIAAAVQVLQTATERLEHFIDRS
ncbi:MarR family transcriptional regulator [Xanthomonas sp. AM6]|uniref:MarR family winged helix-turn-helix transcriptional regulator n=1 Tax=Xanthomonas sp. AM6 TaxID=2982531 RepID=UPI0021DB013A|nr:MarR family transcriptional regulator [Xanthomonas sp. AM6]UYB52562.1 MarR family transcriptional regulator [Xanthomonas sp. AM6]